MQISGEDSKEKETEEVPNASKEDSEEVAREKDDAAKEEDAPAPYEDAKDDEAKIDAPATTANAGEKRKGSPDASTKDGTPPKKAAGEEGTEEIPVTKEVETAEDADAASEAVLEGQ